MTKKPNLFIVGHTRSGTTSLKYYLEQHPDVFMVHNKKGYFGFETDYNSEDEYLKQFSKVKNQTVIAEKCTDYLICPETAKRLKFFNPESKIIIMLRNPVEQSYSLHRYLLNETIETFKNFSDALDAENFRKTEINSKKYSHHLFYREQMCYSKMIKRYFDHFDKKNIFIIIFDDFKKNPLEIFKNICIFLEIDHNFIPKIEIKNVSRAYRSKFIQIIFKRTPDFLKNILRYIPYSREIFIRINFPEKSIPKMNTSLKMQLQKEILGEMQSLSLLLNRDMTFGCK